MDRGDRFILKESGTVAPLLDAFGQCNVAAANRPSTSVKCLNSGGPIVRFFFDILLGLIGTSGEDVNERVSRDFIEAVQAFFN